MSRESRFTGPPTPPAPRRRSPPQPPQDTRRMAPQTSSGIQIRGLARDLDDQRERRENRSSPGFDPRDKLQYDDPRDHDRRHFRSRTSSRSRSRSRSGRDRKYIDHDRPRSPVRSPHNRSPSPRRRPRSPSFGGPPSREIILDGLPADITEDDILLELKAYHVEDLEDVRIIRNRSTGVSRQFGFIRFPTVEASKAFLERNYPTIHLYGNGSKNNQAKPIKVAFSRERAERDMDRNKERDTKGPKFDNDWICSSCSILNYSRRVECLRCKLTRNESEQMSKVDPAASVDVANTGDSDVAADATPSQFLLLRSLEPSVTEEILAKGAAKLLRSGEDGSGVSGRAPSGKIVSTSSVAHAGAKPDCIRRVILIRDRRTKESWRYGFVEFAAVEDAQAALAKFNSMEKFTIASKPVMVSYIHAGVFTPVLKARDARVTFPASTNPSVKLAYWDQEASVSVLAVSENDGQSNAMMDEKSGDPASKSVKDREAKSKKRKAETSTPGTGTKKMASHLQFWTNRHNELHGIDNKTTGGSEADSHSPAAGPLGSPNTNTTTKSTTAESPANANSHQQSYADPNKHCCYLCSRQFKSAAEVNKHERLSDLHQKNLQDTDLIAKAVARLEKAGLPTPTSDAAAVAVPGAASQAGEYRDRAKERRQAFNQPKQPAAAPSKAANADNPASASAAVDPSQAPAAPDSARDNSKPRAKSKSKGASMLASMGYVEGHGLGAAGTGIQAPIAQDMYREGVGLGAEGGKVGDAVEEAARATRADYGEFAEKTREKARERFQKLG